MAKQLCGIPAVKAEIHNQPRVTEKKKVSYIFFFHETFVFLSLEKIAIGFTVEKI